MNKLQKIIFIEPQAPRKPAPGAVCNGCGVCCLLAPCPLGVVLSGRRRGACAALRWQDEQRQYRCGAMTDPANVLHGRLPRIISGWGPWLAPWLARLARRWIAAGVACDSSVELAVCDVQAASPTIQQGDETP
jgi:hypothetical protein